MAARKKLKIDLLLEMRLQAYKRGFRVGADTTRAQGRNVVPDQVDLPHWKRGFEDGRKAAETFEAVYRERLYGSVPQ